MNFCINLGNWNSIFAVPSSVVDKHIKLAGSAQLKVLLWVLRHAGENFSSEDIASALSMHNADVTDAMQYWTETGVLTLNDNEIIAGNNNDLIVESNPSTTNNDLSNKEDELKPQTVEQNNKEINTVYKRPISRPQKPDSHFIANRINDCPDIASLMQEAQVILGRPISNGDSATLLMLHDHDGLPIDVIIMIIQYAVSINKGNMKYIERVAISWATEEIDTIEKAEAKIRTLNQTQLSWKLVQKIIGIEPRSATSKEEEAIDRWVNNWKFNEALIREAYERCVDAKGKYILNYMDSIIKRWYSQGITTIEQAYAEKRNTKAQKFGAVNHTPSYNIEEYESSSIFD